MPNSSSRARHPAVQWRRSGNSRRPDEGLISRRIFADPEIHALELERIFAKAWFFIGHESEIPNPGDIVARQCGVDPVILVRDDAGSSAHF